MNTIHPGYAMAALLAMAAVTFGLRALPFLAAKFLQKHPLVQQLGRFLPLAIMTLLLLHTLVGSARDNPQGPWAELAAVACVMAADAGAFDKSPILIGVTAALPVKLPELR